MTAEQNLGKLGLTLPRLPAPSLNYLWFKRASDLVWVSGQGPRKADGSFVTGKVGRDYSVEQAYEHARLVGLDLLAVAQEAVGSLDKVDVVQLLAMVNAVPEFAQQGQVIDGCSDLLVAVLGERGRHARASVGMGSLPFQITIEIAAVLRVLP
jgi:enamine deaminase RidA (YjgF/YER057c/UK114 family)